MLQRLLIPEPVINRTNTEVTVEKSPMHRIPEGTRVKGHRQGRSILLTAAPKIRNALLIFLPAVIYVLLFIQADVQLFCGRYHRLSTLADDYYYNGWPIETIRTEIKRKTSDCDLFSYLDNSAQHDQTMHRSRLEYIVEIEKSAALDRISSLSSNATSFYLEGIEQPTETFEQHIGTVKTAIISENYDILIQSLYEATREELSLSQQQTEDIQHRIEQLQGTIDDIILIGSYYRIPNPSVSGAVAGIADSQIPAIDKLKEIEQLKSQLASDLDERIVARGGTSTEGKRIVISIKNQHLYMIEDYEIIYDMPSSTGIYHHQTALGEFQVYDKVPMAWGYYHIWMPYWLTIYYSGGLENGIHGIPISPTSGRWNSWDNAVGNYPITYGCVMPHDWDAKTLYEWAEIGTPVSIVQ